MARIRVPSELHRGRAEHSCLTVAGGHISLRRPLRCNGLILQLDMDVREGYYSIGWITLLK